MLGLIGVRDVRNGAAIGLVWIYMREMGGVEWAAEHHEGPIGDMGRCSELVSPSRALGGTRH